MRRHLPVLAALLLCLLSGLVGAQPADGKNAERQVRRLQQQLQGLQQQLKDAQDARAKVEADKAAAADAADAAAKEAQRLKAQLAKSARALREAADERQRLVARIDELDKQHAADKRAAEETLAARSADWAQRERRHGEERSALQRRLDVQIAQLADCSVKNGRLAGIADELAERYRTKTVADVMKQRDPLLGLGDVQAFNLLQDYRDRAEAERFAPAER